MADIDIIETATEGYRLVWRERSYLLRLAAAPFLIKLVCYMTAALLGWERDFLRQALIMLPSFFAEGWMLSHLVRLVFFGQRWPFRPSGDPSRDLPVLQERAQGIMRGALTFATTKYLMAGVAGAPYVVGQLRTEMGGGDPGAGMVVAALAFFLLFIWAFRLVWLFIPAAVNFPLRQFLKTLGGFGVSWFMIGIWLMCFIPGYFVLGLILSVAESALADTNAGTDALFFFKSLYLFLDTVVNLLATAGIALAIKARMSSKKPAA